MQKQTQTAEGRHIDLLLVEDSEDDRVFFLEAMEEARIPVRLRTARDGAEAARMLFDEQSQDFLARPRLIVLDLKMPKVNGAELLRCLKSDPRTRDIPVVIFTSSQEPRDLAESYQLGANSYIVKPMEPERFGEAVRLLGQYWLQLNESPKP